MPETSVGNNIPLPSPLPPPDIEAFQNLISSYKKATNQAPSCFIKKLDDISKVSVHSTSSLPFMIRLAEKQSHIPIYRPMALTQVHEPVAGTKLEEKYLGPHVFSLLW
jgi:hypothetical protein